MSIASTSVNGCFRFAMIAALALVASGASAQSGQKHLVTFNDIHDFKFVGQIQISPDGKLVAYSLNEKSPEIWLIKTDPGNAPRKIAQGTFPVWSPDAGELAFYSSVSGSFQLWVFDTKTDRSRQLTHFKGGIQPDPYTDSFWGYDPLRLAWSPDSQRIVFSSQVVLESSQRETPSNGSALRVEGRAATPLVLTPQTPPDWTLAGLFRVAGFGKPSLVNGKQESLTNTQAAPPTSDQLFVIDIHDKQVKQLTNDSSGYFAPSWSPDGKELVCMSYEGPSRPRDSFPTNVYTINSATGRKAALTSSADYKSIPTWSPDGSMIAFFAVRPDRFGGRVLHVMPANGGEPRSIISKLNRSVDFYEWSADSASLIVNYQNGVDLSVGRINVSSGDVEAISDGEEALRLYFSASRSGDVVWTQSDPSGPEFIRLRQHHARKSHILVDNNPQVGSWLLGKQEIIKWDNQHGLNMEGVLIKPVNYQEGRRYPLIVDAYPQLHNDFKAGPMQPGQAWASLGYAVFYPNAAGPHVWMNPWKGIDHRAEVGPPGVDLAVEGVVSGVDELIRRGIVDPDRMCLYGFSNGGGMVNQVVTKSNRFKCAVSVAAAMSADWSLPFFLQTGAKWVSDLAGSTPWDNPEAYIQLSAVYRLNKVTTPMLLADGDNDGGFLLGTIEMYNGLRFLGRDVTLLRYPNQGHGFEGAAMKDFWERENAFFNKFLKPQHRRIERGDTKTSRFKRVQS